jgi:hypothetical protein
MFVKITNIMTTAHLLSSSQESKVWCMCPGWTLGTLLSLKIVALGDEVGSDGSGDEDKRRISMGMKRYRPTHGKFAQTHQAR